VVSGHKDNSGLHLDEDAAAAAAIAAIAYTADSCRLVVEVEEFESCVAQRKATRELNRWFLLNYAIDRTSQWQLDECGYSSLTGLAMS